MDTQTLWSEFERLWANLDHYPWLSSVLGLIVLVSVALLAGHIARIIILRVTKMLARQPALHWVSDLREHKVFHRVAQMTPSLMIQFGRNLVPDLSDNGRQFLGNLALAITIFVLTRVITALLDALLDIYARTNYAKTRPIKGYIQLGKMLLYVFSRDHHCRHPDRPLADAVALGSGRHVCGYFVGLQRHPVVFCRQRFS